MKKMNSKTKKKFIDIAESIFEVCSFLGFILSMIYKEYDITQIILLIELLHCLSKLKNDIYIKNNIKKTVKKGKTKNEKNINE